MNIGSGSDVDLYGFYFINSKEAYNEEFFFAQSTLRKIFDSIMSEINRMHLTLYDVFRLHTPKEKWLRLI